MYLLILNEIYDLYFILEMITLILIDIFFYNDLKKKLGKFIQGNFIQITLIKTKYLKIVYSSLKNN
jgi:hypothetical protein